MCNTLQEQFKNENKMQHGGKQANAHWGVGGTGTTGSGAFLPRSQLCRPPIPGRRFCTRLHNVPGGAVGPDDLSVGYGVGLGLVLGLG